MTTITPHLHIERIRFQSVTTPASYQRVTPVQATPLPQLATPGDEPEQPAVSRVIPAAPAPVKPEPEAAPVAAPVAAAPAKARGGFFAWLGGLFGGAAAEPAPATTKPVAKPAARGQGQASTRRDGNRPGQGGRAATRAASAAATTVATATGSGKSVRRQQARGSARRPRRLLKARPLPASDARPPVRQRSPRQQRRPIENKRRDATDKAGWRSPCRRGHRPSPAHRHRPTAPREQRQAKLVVAVATGAERRLDAGQPVDRAAGTSRRTRADGAAARTAAAIPHLPR